MILFLDFDGVLHPEPCYDEAHLFCRRALFEDAILGIPQIEIVISSTWRRTRNLEQLRAFFSADIRTKIIGATPDWKDLDELTDVVGQYPRQVEIEGWLRQSGRPWENWLALDDRAYWFKPFLPNLVLCDARVGFDEAALMVLRKKALSAVRGW